MKDEKTGIWHNEIDEDKVEAIRKGGQLSLYGQVKSYQGDQLADVKTIKLFSYQIYNISDDKPKFLIEKTYDITKASLISNVQNQIDIKFSDVMWTVKESDFVEQSDEMFRTLKNDITVIQPVKVRYNWREDWNYFGRVQLDEVWGC